MTVQYSIQKMVSDGTLSTIPLGIQYLQRNDIYIRVDGVETPQIGASSGYTWSFVDDTTLRIMPVVPSGLEVVVYRRTDVDAMYNIYSQNAQFDERTIDENNAQLIYIAQEYLEQGIPGASVESVELVREDGTLLYYRIKLTDGSYTPEFTIPRIIPASFDPTGFTTPEQYGYAAGTGATSFSTAALVAASRGWYVKLDGRQYDIGIVPVEMHGVGVVGNGATSVNGYFKNPGRITGVKYGLISVGQTDMKTPRVFQLPPSAIDGKFLVNFLSNSNIWGIGMNNDRSDERDTFMIMRRGNGGDGPNWEHIRSQQIFYGQTFAFQGLAAATLVGTFTDFSATPIQVGFPSGWASSFAGYNMHFIAKRTTTPTDSIQRVIEPDRDGYVNVGVFVSSTGSSFDVYVDGVLASSGTTAVATTSKPRIRQFKVKVGFNDSYTVKIVHTGVAGKTLTVLGFNVHRPRDTYGSINYDKFALYFDSNADYAAGVGAGDYAMSNDALGFFGSYHGGEIALTPPVWRVDGSTVSSFTPEKPYAGKIIDLMEKTRIWDIVDTHSYQRWAGNGRHEMSITLKGTGGVPFEVKKMYLGMNGTFDAFSRVIYPEMAEGISGASTPDFLCGMTNMVVQENPTTGQVVYTHCNIEEGFPSAKGGVFVKTTDETGSSYQKVYFAWVYDSPMKISKVSAQLVKVFC